MEPSIGKGTGGQGPASTELLRRWQDAQDPEALDELLRREIRFLRARSA